MRRKIHLPFSVRGALKNMTNAEMQRFASSITVNGVQLQTAAQVKDFLIDELAKGHELLPMGGCDNFDWKTGCRGHEEKDDNTEN